MGAVGGNSSFIDIVHDTMIIRKPFSKYPKTFLGTLGHLTSTILLLVALLPRSGKHFFYSKSWLFINVTFIIFYIINYSHSIEIKRKLTSTKIKQVKVYLHQIFCIHKFQQVLFETSFYCLSSILAKQGLSLKVFCQAHVIGC